MCPTPIARFDRASTGPARTFARCLCVSILVTPALLHAQEATVQVEENFRTEPNGEILGRLDPGARVAVGDRQGGWTRVTARGFVYIPSLQVWPDPTLDLVVSAPEGENLRAEPSGRVVGRFEDGTLLEEVERLPGWIEVRRTGWIWTESLDLDVASTPPSSEPPPPGGDPGPPSDPDPETAAGTDAPESPSGAAGPAAGTTGPRSGTGAGTSLLSAVSPGTPILGAPDGDTLARTVDGTELRVLAREGSWARVQLEGWVWVPRATGDAPAEPAGAAGVEVSAADLVREPERYGGRLIALDLQFISLEEAEQVRTDFYEGEPFLLTRSLEPERRFVYVAVPPELLENVEDLSPLEDIRVLGRLRSGAAALTGSPIVDLVELGRER